MAGAVLSSAGLIRPGEGNLSVRTGADFLITLSGADKGALSARDLISVEIGGNTIPQGASSETRMHREIYRRYPGVGAIVHAHPTAILRLASQNQTPAVWATELGRIELGTVGWTGFYPPGSPALAEAVAVALAGAAACILDQHGAVSVGESVERALRRMLLLEHHAALTPPRAR